MSCIYILLFDLGGRSVDGQTMSISSVLGLTNEMLFSLSKFSLDCHPSILFNRSINILVHKVRKCLFTY